MADEHRTICTWDDRAARRWTSVYQQARREGHDHWAALEVANWDSRNGDLQVVLSMAGLSR